MSYSTARLRFLGALAALWIAFAFEVYLHRPTWLLVLFVVIAIPYSFAIIRVLGMVKKVVAERDRAGGTQPDLGL